MVERVLARDALFISLSVGAVWGDLGMGGGER